MIPKNITMSFYRDALHLCFLSFPFDQVSRSLGDIRVQGACEGKRQKLEKKSRRQPDNAVTGDSGETGIQQVHSKSLPAPQEKRAIQQRSLKNMLGPEGKKRWQVAFSVRLPRPHQQPPYDVIIWHCFHSLYVCVKKTFHRMWEGGESWCKALGASTCSCFLLPRCCSFAVFYKVTHTSLFISWLFHLSVCLLPFSPPS